MVNLVGKCRLRLIRRVKELEEKKTQKGGEWQNEQVTVKLRYVTSEP